MKIIRLKANHLITPIGNNLDALSLSWVVAGSTAPRQKNARVEIALDRAFRKPVFDSGVRVDIDSVAFNPDIALAPRTRYFWRVSVVSTKNEKASAVSTFETGKRGEAWEGRWITAPFGDGSAPFFARKTFTVENPADVRVYCAALGVFQIEVNGQAATDEVMLPGYHSYTKQIQIQTFDIAPLLRPGENTIAFHVGWGWYRSSLGWGSSGPFGPTIGLLCEVRAKSRDRDALLAASDASWLCAPSPILRTEIYYGEDVDARREIAGWSTNACVEGDWAAAREFTPQDGAAGPLHARAGDGQTAGVHPVDLPHADAHGRALARQEDGVGLHRPHGPPGELEVS